MIRAAGSLAGIALIAAGVTWLWAFTPNYSQFYNPMWPLIGLAIGLAMIIGGALMPLICDRR